MGCCWIKHHLFFPVAPLGLCLNGYSFFYSSAVPTGLCGTSEPRRGDGMIRQVVSTPAEKTTKTDGNPEGVIGSQSSCLGVVSIGSASSQAASSLCFRSLIRLITLSKMAQRTKNATTQMAQPMIIFINSSLLIIFFSNSGAKVRNWQRIN